MGLLDDAIREHLELKRRRGADPNELDRLEREALGPVRRSPREAFEPPEMDQGARGAEYPDETPEYGPEDADEGWSPPADERSFTGGGSFDEFEEDEEWEEPERGPVQGGIAAEPDTPSPAAPPPASSAEPPPSRGDLRDEDDYLEQETVEHDVEAEHAANDQRDDMLEETPEFLQDTPDHDRLWFEQRPPRDFDLDG